MLHPIFSILRAEAEFAWPPDRLILLHLKKSHLVEWVRAVLAIALGLEPQARDLPPIWMQREQPDAWKQLGVASDSRNHRRKYLFSSLEASLPCQHRLQVNPSTSGPSLEAKSLNGCHALNLNLVCTAGQPLEGVEAHEWVCFEQLLLVQDTLGGGPRTFLSQDDARAFRARAYEAHGQLLAAATQCLDHERRVVLPPFMLGS